MKILFTAPRFHTNQVPIVKGLIEKGHEVRYFVAFVGATEDHTYCEPLVLKPSKTTIREKKNLTKTRTASEVESIIGGRFIPSVKILEKDLLDYMPDIVICRDKTNLTLIVNGLCTEYGIPCILYDQNPIYDSFCPQKSHQSNSVTKKPLLTHRVLLKAKRILNVDLRYMIKCHNASGKPDVRISPVMYSLVEGRPNLCQKDNHSYYIPLVYEMESLAEKRDYFNDGIINVLCVGKFREYKNLPLLIQAFSRSGIGDNWKLTIVGQVYSEDEKEYYSNIVQLIEQNNLSNKVCIVTNVCYNQMEKIYQSNDLLIMPSRRETYGMAIVEAMANGLCVIATNTCGAAFCIHESGGVTIKANDVNELTKAILCAINDRERIRKSGCEAAKYINQNQSFENYYKLLSDMLLKEFDIRMDK